MQCLAKPPRFALILAFIWILAEAVHVRALLTGLVPTAIWSDDAMSYVEPAVNLVRDGVWSTKPKRGPVYTLFIASALAAKGNLEAIVLAQHVLGVAVVAWCCAVAWAWFRRAAWPAILLGGISLALYNQTAYLEHLIRNETILTASTAAMLGFWILAILRGSPVLGAISGVFMGATHLIKGIFAFFPPIAVASFLVALPRRRSVWASLAFIGGLGAVLAMGAALRTAENPRLPREPQFGLLLYARVAQWTVLESGIEPERKAMIREDILDYRRLPKLDNNLILNQTAVPKLQKTVGSPVELEALCRRLAFEAILSHPREYLGQVAGDLAALHFETAFRYKVPKKSHLIDAADQLARRKDDLAGQMDVRPNVERLRAAAHADFHPFYEKTLDSPLFEKSLSPLKKRSPVLTTSILLPLLVIITRGRARILWTGLAAVWFASLLVLCTVGRPLDRYVVPLAPVMFWTMTGALAIAWRTILAFALKKNRRRRAPVADAARPGSG